jgi:uncharacterized membrane protein YfcA
LPDSQTPAVAAAVVVFLVGILKGAVGFGVPTVATPLLALVMDVKTAVALLVVPNIVMDAFQSRRGGNFRATARRLAVLLVFGAVGMVVGTRLLVALSGRVAMLLLGAFVVAFVVINVSRIALRVPSGWERWLSPPIGLLAGVVGGLTNVPGTPLVVYFYALGMDKREFVRSVALSFMVYKVVQLAALSWYGAFSARFVLPTLGMTAAALGGFAVGLRIQDRLDQKTFNRAVLVFLAILGSGLVIRAVSR